MKFGEFCAQTNIELKLILAEAHASSAMLTENTTFFKSKKNRIFCFLLLSYNRYNNKNLHICSIPDPPALVPE